METGSFGSYTTFTTTGTEVEVAFVPAKLPIWAFCAGGAALLVLPLAEELVFRGALLRLLRPLGEHPANLCQAVLFAALHGTLTEKCYALGMGLIFGWAAEQTDSPAPGVVLHILNNGLVLARALAERGLG